MFNPLLRIAKLKEKHENNNLRCNSNSVFICIYIYDFTRKQINFNIFANKTSSHISHKLQIHCLITRYASGSVHLEQVIWIDYAER